MSGMDYNRIAELWKCLGELADEADRLHMKIRLGNSDGGAEYGGRCQSLLERLDRALPNKTLEQVVAFDEETGLRLWRQGRDLYTAVWALATYPGRKVAQEPGLTGQEQLDAAFDRYMEGLDLESDIDAPANKVCEIQLERDIEAVNGLHGWGVFAPEHIHHGLILTIWRIRFECMRGLAEARGHIKADFDKIAGGVEFLRDNEERKIRRRSKTAKATPRRGVDDQMTDLQWDKFLRGLAKKIEADKVKPPKQRKGQQAIIEEAVRVHNDASESQITIGWQGVKKRLQRWLKHHRQAHYCSGHR